ncbi:MAG: NAD-dependent epimerase/dehydratase family protein [Pirellulaceae bacterium]|nr:NAD-dependent epimerase/dehydratase family protein [Pirellulaceae bacterium]
MSVAIITGSAGLVGSEAARFFHDRGFDVAGIDNDTRQRLFGAEASTGAQRKRLESSLANYRHFDNDIRDRSALSAIFAHYGAAVELVIHTAAQPSHDWAARDPQTDFAINAQGTLNLLELTRKHCPRASFVFTSTNKVYGDTPNLLPLVELPTRWELDAGHPYFEHGIDERMSVDQTRHSLFGVSKLAADSLVQEYGRYFGLNTVCFRGGCLTGPAHAGTQLHGFLSYLARCAVMGTRYTVFGYQGKQVRDNIHSFDLVNMFWHYHQQPRPGEVYNAGGGRHSHCSLREAIVRCEQLSGRRMLVEYCEQPRLGDHIWYVSDTRKFRAHYPAWDYRFDLGQILSQIFEALGELRHLPGHTWPDSLPAAQPSPSVS